ncbi:MAG: tetratricopeptide repeat protein [Actinomycetes bacterium]
MGGGTNRTTGRAEGAIARGGRRAASFPLEVPPPRPSRRAKGTAAAEPVDDREPRDSLRRVQGQAKGRPARGAKRTVEAPPRRTPSRRRRPGPQAVRDEILRLGGRRGARNYDELMRAADAFADGRDRDALRILRPLREAMPTSPSVRELYALALYRNGRFKDAARELEEYFSMTGDVTQHPVLMDCYRALGDHETVEARWRELGEESPSSELVTEGRIVLAGSLADRDRLTDAITLLAKRADGIKRVMDHHLRLWYALADLEERSGNLPAARSRFDRIRKQDPGFADVAERLAALA